MSKDEITEEIVAETMEDIEPTIDEEIVEDDIVEEVDPIEELRVEIVKKDEEISSLKDKLVRLQADTDNYRKRLLKDKEDAIKYANSALVKDLLGPLDDFSRALQAASNSDNMQAVIEGVRMIEDRLFSLLKTNWGLEIIDQENVPFDPNEHEACMLEVKDDIETEMVSMILQKGYKVNGRVVRSAKVKVAKKS